MWMIKHQAIFLEKKPAEHFADKLTFNDPPRRWSLFMLLFRLLMGELKTRFFLFFQPPFLFGKNSSFLHQQQTDKGDR